MLDKTPTNAIAPTCPMCGTEKNGLHAKANDIEYFTSENDYEIRHCDGCQVLFVHPMREDELDAIYPTNYYSFTGKTKNIVQSIKERLDRRAFAKISSRLKGNDLRALDIGGGDGWLLDLLKASDDRFTHTTVVDIDDGARETAIANGHDYYHGRFEEYPEGDSNEGFDLILMLNLIEHVPDPVAVFQKAAKLLSPGGVIWVKTPNFDALDARLFRHRSWAGYHTPRHFVIFQKESLLETAAQANLSAASFTYTQGAPFWSISILNEMRSMGLVKGDQDNPMIYHPLTPLLQAGAAAFDFARAPFAKLSQMEVLFEKAQD